MSRMSPVLLVVVILFTSVCDPHPFSGKYYNPAAPTRKESFAPGRESGGNAITDVINVTVVPTSFQERRPLLELATNPGTQSESEPASPSKQQPKYHIFSSTQTVQFPPTIKSRWPAADAESNKSLATIKVSKRDLHSTKNRTSTSTSTNTNGDPSSSSSAGKVGKHYEPHPHPHPSAVAEALPPPEKESPSSLYELEWGNKAGMNGIIGEKLILKLDRDYTPKEIADYVYSTGDEKGITQTVWEMLQDGQIMQSTEDVIRFLEAVQKELKKMRKDSHSHSHQHSHSNT